MSGICPLCHEEVDYVDFVMDETVWGTATWDSEMEYFDYDTRDSETQSTSFTCPHCSGSLDLSEAEDMFSPPAMPLPNTPQHEQEAVDNTKWGGLI